MKDKYYTPKIEELHVGFECEEFINTRDVKWDSITLDLDTVIDAITSFEYGTEVDGDRLIDRYRVKYLDREDIECSSNFKYNRSEPTLMKSDIYHYGDDVIYYKLIHYPEVKAISILLVNLTKSVHPIVVNTVRINNKSEFKKLLKQLNILNND